jgi:hypothetical protein
MPCAFSPLERDCEDPTDDLQPPQCGHAAGFQPSRRNSRMARELATNPETRCGENGNGNPEHTDPLTGPPRTPDELRRLNLEQDRADGAMWPWIVGVAAVIFVVVRIYGYKVSTSNTVGPPPSLSSPTTTGFAPAAPPKDSPLAATPSPAQLYPLTRRTRPWASRRFCSILKPTFLGAAN